MNLGELSIRRGVTTAMIYLCLTGFGLFSLHNLPLNRLPAVELPVIAVVTDYVGASPGDVESLVTAPIERAVSAVQGVESVRSESRSGTSIVTVTFTWGTDMDAAEADVRKNIELFAADALPDECDRPLTFGFDPSLSPVVFLAVEGPLEAAQLRRVAIDQVQPSLGRLEGVAAAEIVGGVDREIGVQLSPTWMQANGVSPSQVVEALQRENLVVPSGALEVGGQRLAIQPTSSFRSVEEIRNVVVAVRGTRPVLLSEVAEVVDGFAEERHVVTANGESAVLVAVRKQSDANTVQVSDAIHEALPGLELRLPSGVRLVPIFDEAEPIHRAIANLLDSAWLGFLLTILTLLAFLRSLRTSLLTALAVPLSVAVAFVAMDALGVTLNLVSLAGLVLAIGMIVDNGIVVLEATFQHVERGEAPAVAAARATAEMTMPVVASTLTTVVVFVPLLLVEGLAGQLFRDLVLTVCTAMGASLLVSITLVPLMASKWVGADHESRLGRLVHRATRFLDLLGPAYERSLLACMQNRRTVLGAVAALFLASLVGLSMLGRDFLPKQDVSEIELSVRAPAGTSLGSMRERMAAVERAVWETAPETRLVTSEFGEAEGVEALLGNSAHQGRMRLRLTPPSERERSQAEIEGALVRGLLSVPGVECEIVEPSLVGGEGADVAVQLYGEDLDELRRVGEILREDLATISGVREARFSMAQGSPELDIAFDRDRMRALALAPGDVATEISTYYRGVEATVLRRGGGETGIRVSASDATRGAYADLAALPLARGSEGSVPLGSVATIGDRLGPTEIHHENQRRVALIEITTANADLGSVTDRVERRLAGLQLPGDMMLEVAGTAKDLRYAFLGLAAALLASIILVYMVMASQFESLLEPLVIMITIPLAMIGVVAALAITGTSVQVTAIVGVILLGGIVVNNGIVLVDVLKRRRHEGRNLVEATLEAGRTRLRPILMTALTTILGVVPQALGVGDGAEVWAPLARAVLGGMFVATGLTLYVVPVLYVMTATWVDRLRLSRAAHLRARHVGRP